MRNKAILIAALLAVGAGVYAEEGVDYLKQGATYFGAKQYDKAEQAFRKATEIRPDSADAWSRLGAFYLTQHRAGDAAKAYQQAIINDPENPKYFVAMAISYLHQGEYNMAHAMTDQALKLDPSLKNATTLARYIDMRQKVIAQASKADAALHPRSAARPMKAAAAKKAAHSAP